MGMVAITPAEFFRAEVPPPRSRCVPGKTVDGPTASLQRRQGPIMARVQSGFVPISAVPSPLSGRDAVAVSNRAVAGAAAARQTWQRRRSEDRRKRSKSDCLSDRSWPVANDFSNVPLQARDASSKPEAAMPSVPARSPSRSRSVVRKTGTVRVVSASRSPGPSISQTLRISANGISNGEPGHHGSIVVRATSTSRSPDKVSGIVRPANDSRSPVRRGRRGSVRVLNAGAVGKSIARRGAATDVLDIDDSSSSSGRSDTTETGASTPPTSASPSEDEKSRSPKRKVRTGPLVPELFVPPSLIPTGEKIVAPPRLPTYFPPLPKEHLKVSAEVDKNDQGTPDEWVKRDGRLIRLTGKHPFSACACQRLARRKLKRHAQTAKRRWALFMKPGS